MTLQLSDLFDGPISLSQIKKDYPNLSTANAELASKPDPYYNCAAFVVNVTNKKWWPGGFDGYYWPINASNTTADIKRTFEELYGWKSCANGNFERRYEKVVIFENNGVPTHLAKQIRDGRWVSKIGRWDDIKHTLEAVGGGDYGQPAVFLRKRLKRRGIFLFFRSLLLG